MTDYRLYLMADDRRGPPRLISCPNDETAIMWADDLREGRPAELWCGERLVRRFEAQG